MMHGESGSVGSDRLHHDLQSVFRLSKSILGARGSVDWQEAEDLVLAMSRICEAAKKMKVAIPGGLRDDIARFMRQSDWDSGEIIDFARSAPMVATRIVGEIYKKDKKKSSGMGFSAESTVAPAIGVLAGAAGMFFAHKRGWM